LQVQKQERLAKAWTAAVAEAKMKGLKGEDFTAFLLKKHDEALK
jgi:hypothetical protein